MIAAGIADAVARWRPREDAPAVQREPFTLTRSTTEVTPAVSRAS
jgi:hypothetical protein